MSEHSTFQAFYAGRIVTGDRKVYHRYLRVVEPEVGDGWLWFAKPLTGANMLGAVYDLTESTPGSGSVFTKGEHAPRYSGTVRIDRDDPRLIEWTANDREAEAEQSRKSALRKADDPFAEVLDVVSKASTNLTRAQRRALAVTIMERLWV